MPGVDWQFNGSSSFSVTAETSDFIERIDNAG